MKRFLFLVAAFLVGDTSAALGQADVMAIRSGVITCEIEPREGLSHVVKVEFGEIRRQEYQSDNGSVGIINHFTVRMTPDAELALPNRWSATILNFVPYLRVRQNDWRGHFIFSDEMRADSKESGIVYLWNGVTATGYVGFCDATFSSQNSEIPQ